jgi:hypothetical protein
MSLNFNANLAKAAVLALAFAGLGGCSADDVQLNGKIFDAVGMNTGSAPRKTPKLAERAPLVVPPSLDKLPEPGTGDGAQGAIADVKDHDEKFKVSRADREREQQEYCKVHYTDAKIRGDQDWETAAGPLGPCRGSILNAVSNWNKSDDK